MTYSPRFAVSSELLYRLEHNYHRLVLLASEPSGSIVDIDALNRAIEAAVTSDEARAAYERIAAIPKQTNFGPKTPLEMVLGQVEPRFRPSVQALLDHPTMTTMSQIEQFTRADIEEFPGIGVVTIKRLETLMAQLNLSFARERPTSGWSMVVNYPVLTLDLTNLTFRRLAPAVNHDRGKLKAIAKLTKNEWDATWYGLKPDDVQRLARAGIRRVDYLELHGIGETYRLLEDHYGGRIQSFYQATPHGTPNTRVEMPYSVYLLVLLRLCAFALDLSGEWTQIYSEMI